MELLAIASEGDRQHLEPKWPQKVEGVFYLWRLKVTLYKGRLSTNQGARKVHKDPSLSLRSPAWHLRNLGARDELSKGTFDNPITYTPHSLERPFPVTQEGHLPVRPSSYG